MNKPLLLDLFCCAGGAGYGYHLAGFEVIGVDIEPQPRYPFTFIQADAFEYLATADISRYDAIHASPPCQRYTDMSNNNKKAKEKHPDLIASTRLALQATGKPYIIENVEGARDEMPDAIMLCGAMFPPLRVYRHRLFESNIFLFAPSHLKHLVRAAKASRIPRNGEFWSPEGCFGQKDDAQRAMGIYWMKTTGSRDTEIAQAIPPAYTKYLGTQILNFLQYQSEGGHVA